MLVLSVVCFFMLSCIYVIPLKEPDIIFFWMKLSYADKQLGKNSLDFSL